MDRYGVLSRDANATRAGTAFRVALRRALTREAALQAVNTQMIAAEQAQEHIVVNHDALLNYVCCIY